MGTQNKAGRPKRDLTENVIRNAMKHTQSNFQAARYLNITIETYRKYAKLYVDLETGKNLYELHKNNSGKGEAVRQGFHQVLLGAKKATRGEHPITLLIFVALNLKAIIRLQIEVMRWIQIMTFMFIILIKWAR